MKKLLVIVFIFLGIIALVYFLFFFLFGASIFDNKAVIKITCRGKGKYFTYYGMSATPYCATKYTDAGRACNGPEDCQSKKCAMDFNEANQLIEARFGKDALGKLSKDNVLSIILPRGSGQCKGDNIPDCFSDIQGGVIIENRKMVDRVPFCD